MLLGARTAAWGGGGKDLTPTGFLSDGLVCYFDALCNAGYGQKDSEKRLVDLSGNSTDLNVREINAKSFRALNGMGTFSSPASIDAMNNGDFTILIHFAEIYTAGSSWEWSFSNNGLSVGIQAKNIASNCYTAAGKISFGTVENVDSFAISSESTGVLRTYKNGVMIETATNPSAYPKSYSGDLAVGNAIGYLSYGLWCLGKIGCFMIYKSRLTEAEINFNRENAISRFA